MANTVSNASNRATIWKNELFKDVIDNLTFTQMGIMGKGSNQVIQVMDDLAKNPGDTVSVPLTAKLSGSGVAGDLELEGNEEAISAYAETIVIDQIRNAVRLTGLLDEQSNSYNMRMDAKEKLSIWMQEFIERQIFLKLSGVGHASLTDVAGNVISARYNWSNAPDVQSNTVTADPTHSSNHNYVCATNSGADSLAATDLLTPELISKAKVRAMLASPTIRPIRVNGRNHYVMFVHPRQAYDLKNNATFAQARREADVRGKENPIFTGALGIWDGVIIQENEYVCFLNTSVGNNFGATGSGTDFAVNTYRALLCGAQAAVFTKSKYDGGGWVEKLFDYDNKTGFATRLIAGIQKIRFNSKDYGVVHVDTAGTAV